MTVIHDIAPSIICNISAGPNFISLYPFGG
jgi:hypothetical protein